MIEGGVLEDIFTEPAQVERDVLLNLGPLRRFAGTWEGDGIDINPKADGPQTRAFRERTVFEAIDPQANGPQLFYGLRYHTRVLVADEDATFHEQIGYWLWEPATGLVLQSLAIPRGQVALAAGHAQSGDSILKLSATRGLTENGICSTAFLERAFRTDSYTIEVTFHGDDTWSYAQDTILMVRGTPFSHRDTNTLTRVGPPIPNPLMSAPRRVTQ